jgi:hypothetical protein
MKFTDFVVRPGSHADYVELIVELNGTHYESMQFPRGITADVLARKLTVLATKVSQRHLWQQRSKRS